MSDETITLAVDVRGEDGDQVLVVNGLRDAWLPKAHVKMLTQPPRMIIATVIEIPKWLAAKAGLIDGAK